MDVFLSEIKLDWLMDICNLIPAMINWNTKSNTKQLYDRAESSRKWWQHAEHGQRPRCRLDRQEWVDRPGQVWPRGVRCRVCTDHRRPRPALSVSTRRLTAARPSTRRRQNHWDAGNTADWSPSRCQQRTNTLPLDKQYIHLYTPTTVAIMTHAIIHIHYTRERKKNIYLFIQFINQQWHRSTS